jgi:uncharacterized protein
MPNHWRFWQLVAAVALGLLATMGIGAQDLRPVPVLSASVIDQTGTLTRTQTSALEAKLAAFEREAGTQIAVLIVSTTQPEDIATYAQRVGEAWKIGRRDIGDGLLIVVAKDDRALRIEVAKALEGAVPDLAAKQILDRYVTPAFRASDYAGGLNAAVDALAGRIRGEALPAPPATGAAGGRAQGPGWDQIALFLLLAVPVVGSVLSAMLGRKLGTLVTSLGVGGLAWVLTASLWIAGLGALLALVMVGLGIGARRGGPVIWGGGGGGGWGGGGGGGGFSSGGGGDFGGGGASGRW